MSDINHHFDLKKIHTIINIAKAKNINGKTSPGKANSEFSPVSINGTRQVIRYAKIIAIFKDTKILLKSLGLLRL